MATNKTVNDLTFVSSFSKLINIFKEIISDSIPRNSHIIPNSFWYFYSNYMNGNDVRSTRRYLFELRSNATNFERFFSMGTSISLHIPISDTFHQIITEKMCDPALYIYT